MRHRVAGKKLNRTSSHRKALAKNLMRALIIEWQGKGHIVTTRSKAKFLQPKIEKLISLSRNKSVHNVRRAMSLIGDRKLVQLLFDEIGPYYKERPGGYTRLLRLVKPRLGDASVRAYLGYVREDDDYPEGDCRNKSATTDEATAEPDVADPVEDSQEPDSSTEAGDSEAAAEEAQAVEDSDSADEEPQDTQAEAVSEESPEATESEDDENGDQAPSEEVPEETTESEEDSASEDDPEKKS